MEKKQLTKLSHPAVLLVGDAKHGLLTAQHIAQQTWCQQQCGICSSCYRITNKTHHFVHWITPCEKDYYVRDDLNVIFETTRYLLEAGQKHLFIVQKADTLSPACANSLLKVIEEPPAGYHFILLSPSADRIIPTIRSRCIVIPVAHATMEPQSHPLSAWLCTLTTPAHTFHAILEKAHINEQQSIELVEVAIAHWSKTLKESLDSENQHTIQQAHTILSLLQNTLLNPPMPGGIKLFWRTLYLNISHTTTIHTD